MADEPKVVELEHPDLGEESRQVFREADGFWNDKLDQIEVLKSSGYKEVPKSRRSAGTSETGEGSDKK